MKNLISIVLIAFCALTSISVPAQSLPKSEAKDPKLLGGLDGGGGLGQSSTPEQVRKAIDQAYRVLGMRDYWSSIYLRFIVWTETSGTKLDHWLLWPEFTPKWEPDPTDPEEKVNVNTTPLTLETSSAAINALLKTKPLLRDSGDCQQGSRPHADASTSSFTLDGRVCLSVENLTRIPQQALLGEILGLLLHEALHLAGVKNEAVAELWQSEFVRYFNIRFGSLDRSQIYDKTTRDLYTSAMYLSYAFQINELFPGDPKILLVLGAFGRGLTGLPYLLDPIALNLAIRPKRPDLIYNYSNAALALYNFTKSELFYSGQARHLDPKAIDRLLKELTERSKELITIFSFYADGTPSQVFPSERPVCRLPKGRFEPEIALNHGAVDLLSLRHEEVLRPLIPPRECAKGTQEPPDPPWVYTPKEEPPGLFDYYPMLQEKAEQARAAKDPKRNGNESSFLEGQANYITRDNRDPDGVDIGMFRNLDLPACAAKCNQTSNCEAFGWGQVDQSMLSQKIDSGDAARP